MAHEIACRLLASSDGGYHARLACNKAPEPAVRKDALTDGRSDPAHGADDQNLAYASLSLFADSVELRLVAHRSLLCHKPQPDRVIPGY